MRYDRNPYPFHSQARFVTAASPRTRRVVRAKRQPTSLNDVLNATVPALAIGGLLAGAILCLFL